MSAAVVDFFEYKYNRRIVLVDSLENRYRDYLEMELAEALRNDTESFINDLVDT